VSETTQRWQVGQARITSVVEAQTDGVPPAFFFPDADADAVLRHDWLVGDYADAQGNISLRVQALVVETEGRTVVVDPCVGNHKQRENVFWNMQSWPFMERFLAAGFDPATVDLVVHTHLHIDHVGWDTHLVDGRWVPTFTRARHVYVDAELAAQQADATTDAPRIREDSIEPVFAAGLADVVGADADLGSGLRLSPTPGHTAGHASLWLTAGDQTALITGDAIHHPLQCAEPQLGFVSDADAEQCRATRRHLLAEAVDTGALMLGSHFPSLPGGLVIPAGDAWRFTPAPVEHAAPAG
jgi:glyoxylase-like metal-dependent hydrolase (beta-lactamase superfamily II)